MMRPRWGLDFVRDFDRRILDGEDLSVVQLVAFIPLMLAAIVLAVIDEVGRP